MAWFFYDNNGNILQVTGAHTLASHTGTLAVSAGGTGATSATAAASALGVGTEDSPEFTGVNVGHASDTTITRASAGDIAVEGAAIYRAGGTDVPLTDGGTGASNASGARTNLGLGAMAVVASPAPVGNGGTGATSLTQNGVLIGNGTSAVAAVDLSTKGHIVVGDGTGNPQFLAVGATNGHALVVDSGEATGLKYASAGVGLGLVIALGG